ncbi:MAG: hypothetical protein J6Q89_04165 [Clostridia bacterium]|nr:hypothetical protein [Clostridia bacterium]
MKKTFVFIFTLMFMILSCVNVLAESNVDASLDVSYSYNTETERIAISAFLVDIKAEEGIISVEYDIKYDPNVLKLVKAEAAYPERWDNYIKNGSIEDLSYDQGGGVYSWIFVVAPVGIGITEDNELGINLEFEPIKKETTKVELQYKHLLSEETENGMAIDMFDISGSNATININFDKPAEPDIEKSDISIQDPNSSESVNSEGTSSESSYVPPISNDPITSGDASGDNWPWDSDEMIVMPSIDVEISAANGSEMNVSSADSAGEEDANGWLVWALVGVGVVAVVIATVVIMKSKRGNK